ncbi:MAG: hypothetical protein Q9187_001933 [Circinaria calcarea]
MDDSTLLINLTTPDTSWVDSIYLNDFLAAVEALPPAYLRPPTVQKRFATQDAVEIRLKSYAFSQGFPLVKQSGAGTTGVFIMKPGAEEATRLATIHRTAGVSHGNSGAILRVSGVHDTDRKDYYNLIRKQNKEGKTKIEQAKDLQARLEALGFHVRPLIKTIWSSDGTVAIGRVMEQIFFCSSAQITIARRFSGFMMQTDVIFNTNKLRLLLPTLGATNDNKTQDCIIIGGAQDREQHVFLSLFTPLVIRSSQPRAVILPSLSMPDPSTSFYSIKEYDPSSSSSSDELEELLRSSPSSLPPTSSGCIRKPTRNETSQQEQAVITATAKAAEKKKKETARKQRKEQRHAGRKTGESQFDAIELD